MLEKRKEGEWPVSSSAVSFNIQGGLISKRKENGLSHPVQFPLISKVVPSAKHF